MNWLANEKGILRIDGVLRATPAGEDILQWNDEGLVLGGRRHGEAATVLEIMTHEHGRHFGLVHGGRQKGMQAVLQPGNSVQVTWRARLDDHLGTFQVEGRDMRTARFLVSSAALHGFMTIAALLRALPERDPHPSLYHAVNALIEQLDDEDIAPVLFVHFERVFLSALGFGLDLSCCAATGAMENLIYVSPKTGRAVGAGPGEPYRDRLLALPQFLLNGGRNVKPSDADILAGFALTGHFLKNWVFEPRMREMPPERQRFISLVLKGA